MWNYRRLILTNHWTKVSLLCTAVSFVLRETTFYCAAAAAAVYRLKPNVSTFGATRGHMSYDIAKPSQLLHDMMTNFSEGKMKV